MADTGFALKTLDYWRRSLLDADRGAAEVDFGRASQAAFADLAEGRLDSEETKKLFTRAEARDAKPRKGAKASAPGPIRRDVIEVVVAAPRLTPAILHQTRRTKGRDTRGALFIPALLSRGGSLTPHPDPLPWMPREALEPGASKDLVLGELAALDEFLGRNPLPDEPEWREVWELAARLFEHVTGQAMTRYGNGRWHSGAPVVDLWEARQSPARFLLELVEAVQERTNVSRQVPGALSALLGHHEPERPLSQADLARGASRHLGQMTDAHPLAPSQRAALQGFLASDQGKVVAVNGPPGTGKTTLLQSVVASLWVERALRAADPPVIVACSTNNQVVKNVIDNFATAEATRAEPDLVPRWLPNPVSSYGLYFVSQGGFAAALQSGYQVVSKSGGEYAGLPSDTENETYLAMAEAVYRDSFEKWSRRPEASIPKIVEYLRAKLQGLAKDLSELPQLRVRLGELRQRTAGQEMVAVEAEVSRLDRLVEETRRECQARLRALDRCEDTAVRSFDALKQAVAAVPVPSPGFFARLARALSAGVRRRRAGEIAAAFAQVSGFGALDPAQFESEQAVLEEVHRRVEKARAETDAAVAPLVQARATEQEAARALIDRLEAQRKPLRERLECERCWDAAVRRVAEGGRAQGRELAAALEDPDAALALLDELCRARLFHLAGRYWEGRWLLEMKEALKDPRAVTRSQSRRNCERRFRRWSMLAPCFVGTVYQVAKSFDCFEEQKGTPLFGFIDLLVMDEAGQVAPEVGAPVFALARQGLAVGDVYQIEPIWSVGEEVDVANLKEAGLGAGWEEACASGKASSCGSAMEMARWVSAWSSAGERGMLLREHRRCLPEIIGYCNELQYAGKLLPLREPTGKELFRQVVWAHVRGEAQRVGTSWRNETEARAMAEWVAANAQRLLSHYGEPQLADVVGIVTPYSAQARTIRDHLGKRGVDPEAMKIGTVHAMQGAERPVVLFSPTVTWAGATVPFFDRGKRMLNVAVSRAKDTFAVIGDMMLFDPANPAAPSGLLARRLFRDPANELSEVAVPPWGPARGDLRRLDRLEQHQKALRDALMSASKQVLIVSPTVSAHAIAADGVDQHVAAAVARGVRVCVAYSREFNGNGDGLTPSAQHGIERLREAGGEVLELRRVHNKTLAVDREWIVEGSFNWLGAVRDRGREWARHEVSLLCAGEEAGRFIDDAWAHVAECGGGS